ncbi:MAG: hydrogenase/urease maturation nickel metallochaperone HypA [Chloroflexota bacterium]
MHEAGLVEQALQDALRGRMTVAALEMEIGDPAGISAEAARLHLEIAMREVGLEGVPVEIRVAGVTCPACGTGASQATAEAFCATCGWPLPRPEGAPLVIRARS